MRSYQLLNQARFAKQGEAYITVNIPHTWNAQDGQDGGNDYWRGVGNYEFTLPNPTPGKRQYIEIRGANHMATIWCNGRELGTHKGGFSTFRFELTDALKENGNTLQVAVSNANGNIYPQHADFTFFGGIYRDVYFVEVEDAHFDLMKDGSNAVFVTPYISGTTRVDMFPVNADGCQIKLELMDAENRVVFADTVPALPHTHLETQVENPHLWHGVEDPYLYHATATLLKDGEAVDQITVTYGYRGYYIDPEKGFFLNGKSFPLHGVCRHQDREDKGWAISKADHKVDAEMIRDIGANTIRLAHYQHDQYFYDLCDEIGFAVWAEIPYISHHLPGKEAYDVTLQMMTELIAQCYNHPSIIVWGIANEITIYNTCEDVTLYINGKEYATVKAVDHAAVFSEVPLAGGENTLCAKCGDVSDTIKLWGVAEHNTDYDLPDLLSALQVGNWFAEQDEDKDYGENGYHCELTLGELLSNERCMELVRGWVMSCDHFDLSMRFKFVSMLTNFRDNENYSSRRLRDMATCKTYMRPQDYENLNKLLRGVKRK